jgi:hypothetical protein
LLIDKDGGVFIPKATKSMRQSELHPFVGRKLKTTPNPENQANN